MCTPNKCRDVFTPRSWYSVNVCSIYSMQCSIFVCNSSWSRVSPPRWHLWSWSSAPRLQSGDDACLLFPLRFLAWWTVDVAAWRRGGTPFRRMDRRTVLSARPARPIPRRPGPVRIVPVESLVPDPSRARTALRLWFHSRKSRPESRRAIRQAKEALAVEGHWLLPVRAEGSGFSSLRRKVKSP